MTDSYVFFALGESLLNSVKYICLLTEPVNDSNAHATVSLGLGIQQFPAESSARHRNRKLGGFHNNNGDATLHTPQELRTHGC
jgi:hypothetical protein